MAYHNYVAYFLWLILGWFGAHHFYLNRPRHAFILTWTFGGGFGVCWFLDLFWIKEYVNLANEVESSKNLEAVFRRRYSQVSLLRLFGEVMVSVLFGTIAVSALPPDILPYHILSAPIMALAVAIGVHTTANIDYECCRLKPCIIGAMLPTCLLFITPFTTSFDVHHIVLFSSIASTLLGNWKGRTLRRLPVKRKNFCVRFLQLSVANILMMGLFAGAVYYNGSLTNEHGETVLIRDAIDNIVNSPAWPQYKFIASQFWTHLMNNDWVAFHHQLLVVLDPQGEENAYQILGLESGASESEVRAQYRKLAKQYHPDKLSIKSEEEKKESGRNLD